MKVVGRFAPSPSGRMHLGNVFSALMAWLSVRSAGGTMVLRIEDLDPDRCRPEYAEQLKDDLRWLGLDWDVEQTPQSRRTEAYRERFERLREMGLVYPCYCSRGELHAASAPHASDGNVIYAGTCRNLTEEERAGKTRRPAWRLIVPDEEFTFHDGLQGEYRENLARECGDFIIRRSDGVYAYQLAVVTDDAEAGVTQIVRGRDLLSSTPRQIYLQRLLGLPTPEYYHVPLLVAPDGGFPNGSTISTWARCGNAIRRRRCSAASRSFPGCVRRRSRSRQGSLPTVFHGISLQRKILRSEIRKK